MKTITTTSSGINWQFYYIVELEGDTATVTKSWRSHKFEDRGEHPSGAINWEERSRSHDISQWMADGRPGGFDGCKDNYRVPPHCIIDGVEYKLVYQEGHQS